jgi:2'-5' RNA ligase
MTDLDLLRRHLLGYGRTLLGYSGGVDSALLAVVGREVLGPERFLAVVGRSASYPEAQWRSAVELARRYDVPLLEVDTGELADPRYLANPTNRCYFCKTELWTRLGAVARARGFDTIIDGTNTDDLGEHRPGLRAAEEHGVRSPLAELGWSKAAVRDASRALGLPTWDAPAAPCLSSRVVCGSRSRAAPAPGRGRRGVSPRSASPATSRPASRRSRPIEAAPQMARLRASGTPSRSSPAGVAAVELDPQAIPRRPARARAALARLMRLFAGIPIVDEARREIVALLGRLRESGWPVRWVHDDGVHLTLKFFGEVAPERLQVIEEAVRFAARGTGPLALRLEALGAFPSAARPRVLWIGVEGPSALELLYDRLERGGEAIGFPPEGAPFQPHVTLGRVREGHRLRRAASTSSTPRTRGRRSSGRQPSSTRTC